MFYYAKNSGKGKVRYYSLKTRKVRMMTTFVLYELAYKESKTSLDLKTSRDKVTFSMVKRYKKKGYTEGNTAMAQKRSNIKYEQIESPSFVKTEIMFKQRS